MHSINMPGVLCWSLPPGGRHWPRNLRSQTQLTGDGSGTQGHECGCHTGQSCQTSARRACCWWAVDARWLAGATANAAGQDCDAAKFASVKEGARTMMMRKEPWKTQISYFSDNTQCNSKSNIELAYFYHVSSWHHILNVDYFEFELNASYKLVFFVGVFSSSMTGFVTLQQW